MHVALELNIHTFFIHLDPVLLELYTPIQTFLINDKRSIWHKKRYFLLTEVPQCGSTHQAFPALVQTIGYWNSD